MSEHFFHMVACAWLDAECDAYAAGLQAHLDYTPISWQYTRTTGTRQLVKVSNI